MGPEASFTDGDPEWRDPDPGDRDLQPAVFFGLPEVPVIQSGDVRGERTDRNGVSEFHPAV